MKLCVHTGLIALAIFAVACEKNERSSQEITSAQMDAGRRYEDPGQTTGIEQGRTDLNKQQRDSFAMKDDFRKDMDEKVAKIDKRLIDVRTKIDTAKTLKAPKAELNTQLDALHAQSNKMRRDLSDIQAVPDANFDQVKHDYKQRLDDLDKKVDDLEKRL
jgi:chromosome segregation ATPase